MWRTPMANMEADTADLMATVEQVRAKGYSQLDPQLVSDILTVQHRFSEDRAEARKRTEQLVNRWAASQPTPGSD